MQDSASLIYHANSRIASIVMRLFAKDLEAVLQGRESLLARLRGRDAKDQLSVELPRGRQVPLLLDLLVNERAVVLQVGTEALGLQSGPDWEGSQRLLMTHGKARHGPMIIVKEGR